MGNHGSSTTTGTDDDKNNEQVCRRRPAGSGRRSESFNCFNGSSSSIASSSARKRKLKQSISCDTALRSKAEQQEPGLYTRLRMRFKARQQRQQQQQPRRSTTQHELNEGTFDPEQTKFINDLNKRLISIKELNECPDPYEEMPAIVTGKPTDDDDDDDDDYDDYGFNNKNDGDDNNKREINFVRVGKFAKSPALYNIKTFDEVAEPQQPTQTNRLLFDQDENDDDMLIKLDEYENLDSSSSACTGIQLSSSTTTSSSSCQNDDTSISISSLSMASNTVTNNSTSDTKLIVVAPPPPPPPQPDVRKRTFRSLFMGKHFLLNKKKKIDRVQISSDQQKVHQEAGTTPESNMKSNKKSLSDGLIYIDEENSYVLKSTSTSGCSSTFASSSRSSSSKSLNFSYAHKPPTPTKPTAPAFGLRKFFCEMNRKLFDHNHNHNHRGVRNSRTTSTIAGTRCAEPQPANRIFSENCLLEISNTNRALEDRCLRDNISVYTLSYLNTPAPLAISENTTLSNSNDNLKVSSTSNTANNHHRPIVTNNSNNNPTSFDCFVIYP